MNEKEDPFCIIKQYNKGPLSNKVFLIRLVTGIQ
jgi:hypothetical protein